MPEPQNDAPTTRKPVGRLIPKPKGTYDPEFNYDILDTVQNQTAVFQSLKPNNLGHPVTDHTWWVKLFDVAEAIRAALSGDAPEAQGADNVAFLMAVDKDGLPCTIKPKDLVDYVIQHVLEYDLMATSLTVNQPQQEHQEP